MNTIDSLIHDLQETTIARRIGIPHDEARLCYRLNYVTARDWHNFQDVIGDYYAYHFSQCVSQGGRLSRTEALGRAKSTVEQQYRRRRSDLMGAFADARDGTNGGLRSVLDSIADALKAESVENYIREQFDSRIARDNYDAKVVIIREFFQVFGRYLAGSVQLNRPDRYAHDYEPLIRAYVEGLQQTSSMFRRL